METIEMIDVDLIDANPFQPRTEFEDNTLMELAQSIQQNGLLQPISLRRVEKRFEIIAGERRFRAMKLNGAIEIPAYVLDKDDKEMAELALIENIQRENLSAVEEAKSYVDIMRLSGLKQSQLALKLGKSQSSIANKIRLLQLTPSVQQAVSEKRITERHARAMIGKSEEQQERVLNEIETKNLTVAQTEKILQPTNKTRVKPEVRSMSKNTKIAVNTIGQAVNMIKRSGTKVEVEQTYDGDDVIMTLRIHSID